MPKPIPLVEPDLSGNESAYLAECVATNFVSSVGPFVSRFEGLVAAATGRGGAVATESGTAALHAALLGLGVQPGDHVLMPAWTFIATANAVSYCGATPVFLDVTAESWTLDPARVDEFITTHCEPDGSRMVHRTTGARIAAVIGVHTLGHAPDMAAIESISSRFGIPVLADAAAALGGSYHGSPAAAHGTLAVLSFNGNKTITCGGGGAIVGNDPALLRSIRHLTTTAKTSDAYDHDRVGFNYRMTNVSAAIGCAQMERLGPLVSRKRAIAARYDAAIAELPALSAIPRAPWAESSCWLSGIVVRPDAGITAAEIVQKLSTRGIAARPFWKPMHRLPPYALCHHGPLPVTDAVWNRVVNLPCSSGLSDAALDQVIGALQEVVRG